MTCCVLGCRDVLLFATLLVTVVTVTETPNDKASQAVAKLKKTEKKAKEAEQVVAAAKVHVEEAKKQMQIKDEMTKKAEEAQKKADAIKDPKAKKKQLAKVKEYENKAKMAQQVMETEMKKVKGGTKVHDLPLRPRFGSFFAESASGCRDHRPRRRDRPPRLRDRRPWKRLATDQKVVSLACRQKADNVARDLEQLRACRGNTSVVDQALVRRLLLRVDGDFCKLDTCRDKADVAVEDPDPLFRCRDRADAASHDLDPFVPCRENAEAVVRAFQDRLDRRDGRERSAQERDPDKVCRDNAAELVADLEDLLKCRQSADMVSKSFEQSLVHIGLAICLDNAKVINDELTELINFRGQAPSKLGLFRNDVSVVYNHIEELILCRDTVETVRERYVFEYLARVLAVDLDRLGRCHQTLEVVANNLDGPVPRRQNGQMGNQDRQQLRVCRDKVRVVSGQLSHLLACQEKYQKLIAKQKAANKDHKKLNVGSVSCKAKPVHKDLKPCADLAKKAAKQLKKSSVKWAIEADTFHHRNTHRVFEMWGSKEDCLNRCVSTPTCIGVTRYTDIQKTGCWGFKSGRLERGRTKFITYVISDRVEGGCAKKGVHTKVTFRVKRNHKWVKGEELWKMPMGKGMKPCATRAAKTNGSSAVMFYKKWCFCYKGGKPESGHNGYLVIMIMRKTVKQIDYKGPEQAKMSPTRKVR
eukprot:TRINITY_DN5015_c1_g2_i6.p1 TRINITY_DN5015_c1_g2~~TRINITY_DN5015_c1_g2_i6.p1  ORF type:complete len:699 (-),score=102.30 TRINITY_DN5015_c1_g2_i6:42-2138(-)